MKKTLLIAFAFGLAGNAMAQLANPGMEAWRTFSSDTASLEAPTNWFGVDSLIYVVAKFPIPGGIEPKQNLFEAGAADAHAGAAAAMMMTRHQGPTLGVVPGILANAKPAFTLTNPTNPLEGLSYTGGTVVNHRVASARMWIKYAPRGGDRALISVQAVLAGQGAGGRDSVVGMADSIITQTLAGYTEIGMELSYVDANVVPDKLLFLFASSATGGGQTPVDSSMLWVDDVSYSMFPLGIEKAGKAMRPVQLSPNPAGNSLFVSSELPGEAGIKLFDVLGRPVLTETFNGKRVLDVSMLQPGTYYYIVTGADNRLVQQDRLLIVR